jgi:CheY-like chemotaxis protein
VASSKILVVDDDPDIRRIAALSLERIGGFRVLLAEDAATALDLVAREAPDLVLLDVSMPGTDGPSVLAAMRDLSREGGAKPVPVVFFTAASNDAEVARLRALGAVGVVPKPFEVADLPRRIRTILADLGIG